MTHHDLASAIKVACGSEYCEAPECHAAGCNLLRAGISRLSAAGRLREPEAVSETEFAARIVDYWYGTGTECAEHIRSGKEPGKQEPSRADTAHHVDSQAAPEDGIGVGCRSLPPVSPRGQVRDKTEEWDFRERPAPASPTPSAEDKSTPFTLADLDAEMRAVKASRAQGEPVTVEELEGYLRKICDGNTPYKFNPDDIAQSLKSAFPGRTL